LGIQFFSVSVYYSAKIITLLSFYGFKLTTKDGKCFHFSECWLEWVILRSVDFLFEIPRLDIGQLLVIDNHYT